MHMNLIPYKFPVSISILGLAFKVGILVGIRSFGLNMNDPLSLRHLGRFVFIGRIENNLHDEVLIQGHFVPNRQRHQNLKEMLGI